MISTTADRLGCRAFRPSAFVKRRSPNDSHPRSPQAVAAPPEIDVDVERQRLAKETGYRSIGRPLPLGITLMDIVQTLPEEAIKIDDWKAWRAVAITIGSTIASLCLVAATPWYLLPFSYALAGLPFDLMISHGYLSGTAVTGLFVIGHDCGHRSFSKNRLVEDIVGTVLFAPLLYPFEPWRIKHNHHHAHTNKLGEDTAWHPMLKEDTEDMHPISKIFLASPLKCFASIGHWLYYHFDKNKYTKRQMPRVVVSWFAVAAFGFGVLPWIAVQYGWLAVVKFWLVPWLGYHFWMSTFTVVHHTAPHIPFRSADDWNAAEAQLSGSVHCDYPAWVDFLTHDISWHVPHHVSSKIPWYNLRKATSSLRENWGDYMTECTFNWRMMKTIFTELHVHDEEKVYIPVDFKKESPFLKLQRMWLPDYA